MRILFLLLLFPSLTFALSTVTRHVTPGCTHNGDGTSASCAASAGAAGAYNTWSAAEDDIDGDYVDFTASDVIVQLQLHAGTANDVTNVGINGVTTDATRYYDIVCDSGYKLVKSHGDGLVQIYDANVRITGCYIEQQNNGFRNIDIRAGATGDMRLINNKLIGGNWAVHAYAAHDAGMTLTMVNNIMSAAGGFRYDSKANDVLIFYNNTCYQASGNTCFIFDGDGASDAAYRKNNIANNCTDCWQTAGAFTTSVSASNITSDTDSPDGASYQSKTCTFVDTAGKDFHLASGDTNCKDAGTDLSGDAQWPFSDDIDGDTRSGSWDIGADELAGSSTPTFSVFEAIGAL